VGKAVVGLIVILSMFRPKEFIRDLRQNND
jgi:hypothetical protein